jgi:uncharacterized lipoprotein YmbA
MKLFQLAAALTTVLAAGCASAPVHYYSLVAASPASPTGTNLYCCRIVIASVKLPPAVDRPEIILRGSDNQLQVLGNDLWIAPLRDEVRSALTDQIRLGLVNGEARHSLTQDNPATIHLDVERFESEPSRHALIQIAWRVSIPALPRELSAACETATRVAVGEGVPALVQGYQQALSAIAAQIASGIRNLKTSGENGCGTA